MHILLIISNPRMLRHMLGTVKAAAGRGHKVTVFFNEESVKLLTEHNTLNGLEAEMLACVTACQYSGLEENALIPRARMSSLGEVTMLMETADRTLFMG
ncbi:MAG: DsrE family protein [Candidatus Bathyarchaeota archaeon]|nr:DsrE family protein [Candidatus Bathyarchaeota archaeon]